MKTAILLATYNGEKYLGQLLASLENQTVDDFVVYIHDDGSKDGTVEIIQKAVEAHPERYVFLKDKKRRGAKGSFFWLLKHVKADVYFFADDDDVWMKEKVEKLRALLPADEPAVVFCDMKVTDAGLNVTAESFITYIGGDIRRTRYQELLMDNIAAGCAMCVNRQLRDLALNPVVDKKRIPMHDVWLMVLAAAYGQVIAVPEPLVYYRQHGGNEVGANAETIPQKLFRNVSDLVSGRFAEHKREFLSISRRMAWELLKYDDLPNKVRSTLRGYVMLPAKNKLARIRFCRKHHFDRPENNFFFYLYV